MKPAPLLVSSLAVLAVCGALSPSALAQRGPGPGGPFGMLRHDQNQDGQLTRAEFTTALQAQFAAQDTNSDGVITNAERVAARDARREAAKAARFAALDQDGDGELSASEFGSSPDGAAKQGSGRRMRAAFAGNGRRAEQQDVTYAEFSERALERFQSIDTDSDNVVTQAELHAAIESHRNDRQ